LKNLPFEKVDFLFCFYIAKHESGGCFHPTKWESIKLTLINLKMQSKSDWETEKGCRVDFSDEFVSKNICLTVGAKQ